MINVLFLILLLATGARSEELNIGLGRVDNAQFSIGSGSLPPGTYYYKIWPVTASNKSGFPSREFKTTLTQPGSVNLSWNPTSGASYYRIQRSAVQGGGDGYFQTADTSFTDSGQSFDGQGNALTAGMNDMGTISGAVKLPASSGAIVWEDYVTGQVSGAVNAATSAGEFHMVTGSGSHKGTFIFSPPGDQEILNVVVDYPDRDAGLTWQNGAGQAIKSYWEAERLNLIFPGRRIILRNEGLSAQNDTGVPQAYYIEASPFTVATPGGNFNFRSDGTYQPAAKTLSQLNAGGFPSMTFAACSNCAYDTLCVSTGTAPNSFVSVVSRTLKCQ